MAVDKYKPALKDITGILDKHPLRGARSPAPPSRASTTTRRSSPRTGSPRRRRTSTRWSPTPSRSRPRAARRSTRWAATGGPPSGGCRCSSPTPRRPASGTRSTRTRRSSPTRRSSTRSRSTRRWSTRACSTRTSRRRRSRTRARRCSTGKAAMVVQVNSFFGQLQAQVRHRGARTRRSASSRSRPSGNVGTFIPDQSNALVAFKTGDAKREAAARQLLSYWMGPGYPDFVSRPQHGVAADRRRPPRPACPRR